MTAATITGISKRFGATQALSSVTLSVASGTIHGIVGENGAGKSTLTKILAGIVTPDSGSVYIGETPLRFGHPRHARGQGVYVAFQELSAPPNVTVAEKLLYPDLPRSRMGVTSRKTLNARATEILARFDRADIPADARISDLYLAERQYVEIVAALSRDPALLILDEPTSSLPNTEWLFRTLREARDRGAGIIYISHKLPEIRTICQQGTVLRNGRVVESFDSSSMDEAHLVETMIGRSLSKVFPAKRSPLTSRDAAVVTITHLATTSRIRDFTLTIHQGQLIGIAALEGQGQKELFYTLAGLEPRQGGEVHVARKSSTSGGTTPPFSLVPEDRKTEGLFLSLPTQSNVTITRLSEIAFAGTILRRREKSYAGRVADSLNLPRHYLPQPVERLSGGSQQKVLYGRAVEARPRCLLLFDPTRGVDAGTKVELYRLARSFTEQGGCVLMYSTEIPELVGLCDRVYALYDGEVTGMFEGSALTDIAIMNAMLGHVGAQQ